MLATALPFDRAVETVIGEFEFRDEEKTLFLALVVAMVAKIGDEIVSGLLILTQEVIPPRVLEGAFRRLDDLTKVTV